MDKIISSITNILNIDDEILTNLSFASSFITFSSLDIAF